MLKYIPARLCGWKSSVLLQFHLISSLFLFRVGFDRSFFFFLGQLLGASIKYNNS